MKTLSTFIILFFFSFAIQAQSPQKNTTTFKEIVNEELNTEQAKTLLYNASDMVVLDVRTLEEFNTGHIDNAINIDYNSPDFNAKLAELDKSKTYLLYCRSGARSAKAREIMVSSGFKHLYHLKAGYLSWEQK